MKVNRENTENVSDSVEVIEQSTVANKRDLKSKLEDANDEHNVDADDHIVGNENVYESDEALHVPTQDHPVQKETPNVQQFDAFVDVIIQESTFVEADELLTHEKKSI